MTQILICRSIDKLRRKLLDLTGRNSLISFREAASSTIRITDELPDETFRLLFTDAKCMRLLPYDPKEEVVKVPASDILKAIPPIEFGLDERTGMFVIEKLRQLGSQSAWQQKYPNLSSNVQQFAQRVMDVLRREWRKPAVPKVVIEHTLPTLEGEPAERHIDDALQTPLPARQLERRCVNILRMAKRSLEETGVNILHLAIGFLEWVDPANGRGGRAPLILIPLEISKRSTRANRFEFYVKYSEGEIETNLSLAELCKQQYGVDLPAFESEAGSPEKYFEEVAKAVAGQEGWKVVREMVLGFFSFAKLRLYRDLDPTIWPGNTLIEDPTVQALLIGRGEQGSGSSFGPDTDLDAMPEAQSIPLVMRADSSQELAVLNVLKSGRDTVIHGPPGTGKSQTITNLIAAALTAGKTVLFVAEKKAALDVVRSRLDGAGLGVFCFELHSHKARKERIHADLTKRLKAMFPPAHELENTRQLLLRERDKLRVYYAFLRKEIGRGGFTVSDILWGTQRWRCEAGGLQIQYRPASPFELTRIEIDDNATWLRDFSTVLATLSDEALSAWQGYVPLGLDRESVAELRIMLKSLDVSATRVASLASGIEGLVDTSLAMVEFSEIDPAVFTTAPSDLDQGFLALIVAEEAASAAREHARIVCRYQDLKQSAAVLRNASTETPQEQLGDLLKRAAQLWRLGLADLQVLALGEFLIRIDRLVDRIAEAKASVAALSPFFAYAPSNLSGLKACVSIQSYLDDAPECLSLHAHPKHALKLAAIKYDSIKTECTKLQLGFDALRSAVHLEKLPDTGTMREWASRLSNASFFAKRLSPAVRQVKRQVRSVLQGGTLSVWEAPPRLLTLADLLDSYNSLTADEDVTALLGPRFRGLDSDWQELDSMIVWCQGLVEKLGSEAKALTFLGSYLDNKETLSRVAADLDQAVQRLCNELESLPPSVRTEACLDSMHTAALNLKTAVVEGLESFRTARIPDQLRIDEVLTSIQALLEAKGIEKQVADDSTSASLLGAYRLGFDADTRQQGAHLAWRESLCAQLQGTGVAAWVLQDDSRGRTHLLAQLHGAAQDYAGQRRSIFQFFENHGSFNAAVWLGREEGSIPLESVARKARQAESFCKDLIAYGDYMALRNRLANAGMDSLANLITTHRLGPDRAEACYRYAFFVAAAAAIFERHPQLAEIQGVLFENCRERFKGHAAKLRQLERRQIAAVTAARPVPQGEAGPRAADFSDLNLIVRELGKKKRHIPIRRLVERAGQALLALKPCFMMSPMSVAQYLIPGQLHFDMVVMDEASQLRVEDALGAIARGTQAVVVGDPKQLPPTNFFKRFGGDEDEEEEITDMESVLDLACPFFNNTTLRWHYRSVHESLIEFSNEQFYDHELVFFPSACPKEQGVGVFRHYIEDGVFKGKRNAPEALAVVKAVQEHYHKCPKMSLGVATSNIEQRDLILTYIDKLKESDPLLKERLDAEEDSPRALFVKNLENVQGDERDVIFISTTYGPPEKGLRPMQRFGPINSDVGWRRLNVIITRAKHSLHVFTSLRSSDILVKDRSSRGLIAFHDYLHYLETGRTTDRGLATGKAPDSDFEIAVAKALQQQGYTTVYQVGVAGFFIDIGVLDRRTGSRYLLGIECDGATYHSARSVRDRDILRQEMLESRGWTIHRIWSTDWFKSPEREIQRVLERLRQLEAGYASNGPEQPAASSPSELHSDLAKRAYPDKAVAEDASELSQRVGQHVSWVLKN
ncbi:DUF4011 domain-containing protein [Desulfocurvibacter africanus]|uniref:RAP domain-containing protein n=1 Tax=Desulfocurvibacter africanus subsp. africanus str. Walvis Bay TaxID=690850 RepID=F3YXG4_DESAF|nr:DUF4011 domain-containing protein [Desulfocurvibacter africanus]EGJ51741.1 hypothetical protein Desaf_3457 [Desulfocurvibacter africanus subsp. africanus str. Walvis Bay]